MREWREPCEILALGIDGVTVKVEDNPVLGGLGEGRLV